MATLTAAESRRRAVAATTAAISDGSVALVAMLVLGVGRGVRWMLGTVVVVLNDLRCVSDARISRPAGTVASIVLAQRESAAHIRCQHTRSNDASPSCSPT